MKASWCIARHTLGGRKGRTILLILAVMMGAALTASLSTGMRSLQASIEYRITKKIGKTDARVVHRYSGTFESDILDDISEWPGVAEASARLTGSLTLARTDGKTDENGRRLRLTARARGVDVENDEDFEQIDLLEGRLPRTTDEILIDPLTAKLLQVNLGDELVVERFGPPIKLKIVGLRDRQIIGALQKPSVQVDRSVISEAVGRSAKISVVSIILDDGLDTSTWVEQNAERVEAPLVVEAAELARTGYNRQIEAAGLGLVLFTVLGFLVCSLIVAVGMTTAVNEQVRQMAMIRCIGGARTALAGSQIMVGGFIGGIGAILGTPLGILLAGILVHRYSSVMKSGLVVSNAGLAAAAGGAIFAGILGALYPAWRSSRTSPLAALAVRAQPATIRGVVICGLVGVSLVSLQVILLLIPDASIRFWFYEFLGLPSLIIGYFMIAVPVFAIVAKILGPLSARVWGLPRPLLLGSLKAGPFRLGMTAGALMLGLATLVSIWSNGLAMVDDMTERIRFADAFAFRSTGLSEEEQKAILALPEVESGTPVGYLPLRVSEDQRLGVRSFAPANVTAIGFEPTEFLKLNRIDWIQGDPETAIPRLEDGDAVLVAEEFLTARGMGVGDTITLGTDDDSSEFEIVGVVGAGGLDLATQSFGIRNVYMEQAVSCVFLDFDTVAEKYGTREAYILQLDLKDGAVFDEETELNFAEKLQDTVPGIAFATGRSIKEMIDDISSTILNLSITLAFAALAVACLGVANVVAAGVAARTFEFGVLRAVGGKPGLGPRLVLAESTITGIAATIVGFVAGIHFAWNGVLFFRDLAGLNLSLSIPYTATFFGAIAVVLAVLIATAPASIALVRKPARVLLSAGRDG